VGEGFSVNAGKLAAGSQDLAGLQSWCAELREGSAGALQGMSGSAGHAGLASALAGAEGRGAKAFVEMAAAYRHVIDGLAASAANYAATERDQTGQARALFGPLR
jgi:hypothetical protein